MKLESLNEFNVTLSAKQLLSEDETSQIKGGRMDAEAFDVWTDCQYSTPKYCGNNDDGEED